MYAGVAFVAAAVVLTGFAALAMIRVALARLESPIGIWRDGVRAGLMLPAWSLPDRKGVSHSTPSHGKWQLLLFADHSLREFPAFALRVRELSEEESLEALILTRRDPEATAVVVEAFGLKIPVVPVDDRFYWRCNVRVMPYVMIVDPHGTVWASNVVTTPESLDALWRITRAWALGKIHERLPRERPLDSVA
jgi:hypothetical protein